MLMKTDGSVMAPRGFRGAGYGAYALITCGLPAVCAGVYGKNHIESAPRKWTSFITSRFDTAQALFISGDRSGAFLGEEGYQGAVQLSEGCAKTLGIPSEKVLLGGAGQDGVPFAAEEAESAMQALSGELSGETDGGDAVFDAFLGDAAGAQIAVEFDLGDKKARIGGMCRKDSTCAILTTDVAISKEMLERALSADAEETFFMSMPFGLLPGDMVLCMASGMAGNKKITEEDGDYSAFCTALRHVTGYLAKSGMALEILVTGAADKAAATILSKKAAQSAEVRMAAGEKRADFGGFLSALGETEVPFDPSLIDVHIRSVRKSVQLIRNGTALPPEKTEEIFDGGTVTLVADMKNGNASAQAFTNPILRKEDENDSHR